MNLLLQHPINAGEKLDVTSDMREYYDVLVNPKSWGERFLCNRDGSPRSYRNYQVIDLLCSDNKIVHRDGRDVGKTVNLSTLLLWYTFAAFGGSEK